MKALAEKCWVRCKIEWPRGAGYSLAIFLVATISPLFSLAIGFADSFYGLIFGVVFGPTVIACSWLFVLKNRDANMKCFKAGGPARGRAQVYPTAMCSIGFTFTLIVGPLFGAYCSSWLVLASEPTTLVLLNPASGTLVGDVDVGAQVFHFRDFRLGMEAIASYESGGTWTCLAPIFGRNETAASTTLAPVMFMAMCQTSHSSPCNSSAAAKASSCIAQWTNSDVQWGLKCDTADQQRAEKVIDSETSDLFYLVDADFVAVEWLDVSKEEKNRKITFSVVVTLGNLALAGGMFGFHIFHGHRKKNKHPKDRSEEERELTSF